MGPRQYIHEHSPVSVLSRLGIAYSYMVDVCNTLHCYSYTLAFIYSVSFIVFSCGLLNS